MVVSTLTRDKQRLSGRSLSDQAALFRTALLAPHGDGPKKGGPNIALSHLTQLASRGQQGIFKSGGNNTNILKFGCWNVRTMMDSEDNERPQRRSALVAKELARLKTDIAALSEVRFADHGSLTEHGTCYTLYWSGKTKEECRLSGVGFMMKTQIANRLQSLPIGHSDRLMFFRLPIQDNRLATVISVYAPTLLADAKVKEAFYSDLRNLPPASQIRRQSPHTRRLQRESGTRLQRVDRSPGQTRCRKLQR